MRTIFWLFFTMCTLLVECSDRREFTITIDNRTTKADTLFIRDFITKRILAKIPLNKFNEFSSFGIQEATIAEIRLQQVEKSQLSILRPGINKTISIDTTTFKIENSLPDSLLNYILSSTNKMFEVYGELIFDYDDPEKVKEVFDSLIQVRNLKLRQLKSQLTYDEFELLQFQNTAQVYSFLMFYGRTIKQYEPRSGFFNFVNMISNENIYSKTLPNNLLYKYEIEFLQKHDSLESIDSFLKFIEQQTSNIDLREYLKAVYLKSVIEYPFYWKRHEKLFTSTALKSALQREGKSKYTYLIEKASDALVNGWEF